MLFDFTQRAQLSQHPFTQRVFQTMQRKQSNLCLSADVTTAQALLDLADEVGPMICMLKTHIDCIDDFSPALTQGLRDLASQHDFLIFEDRKFADIGHTVKHQFGGGIYRIADWADCINAHPLPGPGIIDGLSAASHQGQALLLIAQMSSEGHLMDEHYIKASIRMAEQHDDFVAGFITGHRISARPDWLYMTPGVRSDADVDNLGQRYVSPEAAMLERQSDMIIVGRGIIQANDRRAMANAYRHAAWQAHEQRL